MFRLLILLLFCYVTPVFAAVWTTPLTAPMDAHDAAVWTKSDGWSNGAPFQVGWRADHLVFSAGVLNLTLDNQLNCASQPANCSNQPYAAGEYRTIPLVSYGRIKFRAKAVSASGVVTGLFLYTGAMDGQQHDEIDIEFLGNNTSAVQFNYYINGVGGHEFILNLGFDASLLFHDYEIEWLPSSINWYVDGVLKHTVSGAAGVVIPSFAQHIFMNVWATTGVNGWAGAFVYATPLTAQVDLVTYTPVVGSVAKTSTGGCTLVPSERFDPVLLILLILSFLYLYKHRVNVKKD